MVQLMMSTNMLFLENGQDLCLETICKPPFCKYCVQYFCFVQWGGWEGMNKPDLQLNLYDLISCSCWDMWVCNFFLERVTRK